MKSLPSGILMNILVTQIRNTIGMIVWYKIPMKNQWKNGDALHLLEQTKVILLYFDHFSQIPYLALFNTFWLL